MEHKRQEKLQQKVQRKQQKMERKQQQSPVVQLPQQRLKPQPQQSASQPKDERLKQSQLEKKMFDEMEKFRRQPVIEQQQIQLLNQRLKLSPRRSPERRASSICQIQPGAASPEVQHRAHLTKPKQKRAPLQRAHSAAPQHQPEAKELVSKRVYVSRNSAFVDRCGYFKCDVCNKRVCHSYDPY